MDPAALEKGAEKTLINLVIPAVAVALVFVLRILTEIKTHTLSVTSATDAGTSLAMYLACIAALEILSQYEPQISSAITPIAGAFAAAEFYSAGRLLMAGTGNAAAAALLQEAGKLAAPAAQSASTSAAQGSDPFGAAKIGS